MFGFNVFPVIPRSFQNEYSCFSVALFPGNEREDVERGGKIIMPPSALEQLTRLNIDYPMLFKITNRVMDRITHCGVLEFIADEERVYLPHWMMRNLILNEGDTVLIESIRLPVATFSKFQPQSPEFLDITNPKAVLENCLRNFACLTTGDIINLKYNMKDYELSVLETEPGNAVTIIECDMNVEFAPPIGYEESKVEKRIQNEEEMLGDEGEEPAGFVPFRGAGHRLDGKGKKGIESISEAPSTCKRGIPDYEYEVGTITFLRNIRSSKKQVSDKKDFEAFGGEGNLLRQKLD